MNLRSFAKLMIINFGAWKHEASFSKARFIRQKCYIEEIENEIKITCAGLPAKCYNFVTWENFKTGFKCGGKLVFKHVRRWRKISRNRIYY